MAKRYHVSEDGVSRVCRAKSAESCTAQGVDGGAAPHGEFASAQEAQRFAERVLEDSAGADLLKGSKLKTDRVSDLRESVKDYRNPRTTEIERGIIRDYWRSQGVTNQFSAMARAKQIEKFEDRLSKIGKNPKADARRFDETTKEIESISHAIDELGGQMPPEFSDYIAENDALGKSLGREGYTERVNREIEESIAANEAARAAAPKPRGLFGRRRG